MMWFLDLTNLTALPLAPGAPEFVNIPLCRGAHWMVWTMTRLLSFMGQRSNLPVNSCIGKVAGHDFFFFLCQVRSPPLGLILFVCQCLGPMKITLNLPHVIHCIRHPSEFCATPKPEKEALPKSYKSQAQRSFNSDSGQTVVSNIKC